MDREITPDLIGRASAALRDDAAFLVARNAATSVGVKRAARNPVPFREFQPTFQVSLSPTGKVTAQKKSGRCWLFAAYNVMRDRAMSNLGVKDFEFSQAYGQFWDKFEKANLFLERMIDLRDEPLDDRMLTYWLMDPITDGGWWDMATSEVAKYGAVPKSAMPETAVSGDTAEMNEALSRLLRDAAVRLRARSAQGAGVDELRAVKEDALVASYRVLSTCLGEPPATFEFSYIATERASKDGAAGTEGKGGEADEKDFSPAALAARKAGQAENADLVRMGAMTPKEFFDKVVGIDFDDYVCVANLPGDSRPYGSILRMDDAVPCVGTPVRCINEPVQVLLDACVAQLRAGHPVWFACDVLKNLYRDDGIGLLDTKTVDLDALFGTDLRLPKADALDSRDTQINHAMTLQGVELDAQGRPVAWRVENSWGEDAGKDGYLTISNRWMEAYLGQVVVMREFLPQDVVDAWDDPETPVVALDPWSPLVGLSD